MNRVILARFYLNRNSRKAVVIINKIVNLSLTSIIIIVKFIAVSRKFACHNAVVSRTEIHTRFIIKHGTDIVAVQNSRQNTDIVQIKLKQIFARWFNKRKNGIWNCLNIKGDPCTYQILEFILIVAETLTAFILNIFCNNPFLFVFHIWRNEVINSADFKFVFIIVFWSVCSIIFVNFALYLSDGLNISLGNIAVNRIGQSADKQILSE